MIVGVPCESYPGAISMTNTPHREEFFVQPILLRKCFVTVRMTERPVAKEQLLSLGARLRDRAGRGVLPQAARTAW
jgi:hypothetical protein